jgi:predicted phage terminase large subunit-like protein
VGTPWAPNDLYATQLKRNEEDGSLAFRIDPIVELRPHACHKMTPALLSTLTEDDVVSYLLPVRMPWRFVKKEIAANPTFALSQNFCVFPTEADAELRCQFERDALLRRTHPASQYGQPFAPHYLSLDRAWSLSKAADLSALAVGRVQSVEGKSSLVVVDCIMDRYRESELVKAIVDLIQKHRVKVFVFERERGHSELDTAVRRECQRRGIPVPWMKDVPIDNSLHAKAKRAKQMEMPIHDGRLHFVSGPWIDPLFAQFESFDGITRSTSSRKDDGVDAVAILWSEFGPKYKDEIPKEDEEKRKRETEEEYDRARRLAYHERMHGTAYSTPRAEPTQPTQSQASTDARFAVLPFGLKGRPSNR